VPALCPLRVDPEPLGLIDTHVRFTVLISEHRPRGNELQVWTLSFTDADLARLLIALAVLLLAAHSVGALFARFRQPRAIGEIVGGILLGPSALGAAFPGVQRWIFPASGSSAAALGAVYQLGLLLLMFAAGAEMRRLIQRNAVRTVGLIASFGLVLPFAAGLGLVAVLGPSNFIGAAGNKTALTLVFGMAVAVTSIPVISRIMHDTGLLGTRFSRIVLSVAVIEDIVLYVVLAVTIGLVQASGSTTFGVPAALKIHTVAESGIYHTAVAVLFLGLALTLGGRAYKALIGMRANPMARCSPIAGQLLWMLALSAAALALGLVPLYGAFVAGITVAMATGDEVVPERNALAGVSFGFFIPVYFAIIGIQLDLIHHFAVLFFLGFLAFACAAKAVSVYLGARLSRENSFMSASLAIAMNARGGPGIVLASTAFAAGIINQTFFVSLVMLSIVTSLLAGSWLERVADRLTQAGEVPLHNEAEAEDELSTT
jgi:Kef-type K+ transport system membrane component KefB